MNEIAAVVAVLVAIIVLFEVARRLGVPYPTLFVLGGLALGLVPGLPRIELEPDLVLLVFLPPLLFGAAIATPIRELRANLGPVLRLAIGLVIFTMVIVAGVTALAIPGLNLAAAFTLGAIVAPTDALAATTVFRKIDAPRIVATLVEGEALFNDATALVAYRAAVAVVVGGTFVLASTLTSFVVATVGGIALGWLVGRGAAEILNRLDDAPVEVLISIVVPFAAYLPAEALGISGVLATVTAGLVIGSRLGTILSPASRVLWISTWEMVEFVLNGFVFVLIGLALPDVLHGVQADAPGEIAALTILVSVVVIGTRLLWVALASRLPGSPGRRVGAQDPRLGRAVTFVVGWAGLRGAVSLAAALALPDEFPVRDLIILTTFVVILVTLVGQGLSLPFVVRRLGANTGRLDGNEVNEARAMAYMAGLLEIERIRVDWPGHEELIDRIERSLRDRTRHLATPNPAENAERDEERIEHQEIQREVITAQRGAVIEMRDRGEINDQTLRVLERELDLEELRMEG